MFRSQQIIIREYVCTSLKLLNYLKNTEFKILNSQNHITLRHVSISTDHHQGACLYLVKVTELFKKH